MTSDDQDFGTVPPKLPKNIAAAVACLPLFGGIAMLVLEPKDRFIRFYALQSVYFGLVWGLSELVIKTVAGIFLSIPLLGIFFGPLFWILLHVVRLGFLAVWAFTTFRAISNTEWEIPWVGAFVRRQMAGQEPPAPPM